MQGIKSLEAELLFAEVGLEAHQGGHDPGRVANQQCVGRLSEQMIRHIVIGLESQILEKDSAVC
jgi:hypothetical protein